MKKIQLNYIRTVSVIAMLGIALSSCKKTLDVNVDPNNPTDVPANVLLPSAQVNLAFTVGGNASRYAGGFIQHYGGHRAQPLTDYGQYVNYLRENPHETDVLFHELLIGVTKFFRDAQAFEVLKEKLYPLLQLKKNTEPIRVWVAGCST